MYPTHVLAALTTLLATAQAWTPPNYSGYKRVWQATFIGSADALPSTSNWNFITGDKNYNNELQRYTANKKNVRMSGSGTLQIIPRKDSSAPNGWTSARIESKYTPTPTSGKSTRFEASLRIAGNPQKNKQGMWYAFWMLGEGYRTGTTWPACGEIDIFENINGDKYGHGSMHCDVYPGGVCNEPTGLASTATLSDNKYHVWRVEIDRKNSNWQQQSITWSLDGKSFQKVTGATIGTQSVWKSLCQSPLYFILNVAVGGNWVCSHESPCMMVEWCN